MYFKVFAVVSIVGVGVPAAICMWALMLQTFMDVWRDFRSGQ